MSLEELKDAEIILAGNYYENFKFHKDLALAMGGNHPRVVALGEEVNKIQREWHEIKEKIKEYE
jgi:hypothetical protein